MSAYQKKILILEKIYQKYIKNLIISDAMNQSQFNGCISLNWRNATWGKYLKLIPILNKKFCDIIFMSFAYICFYKNWDN